MALTIPVRRDPAKREGTKRRTRAGIALSTPTATLFVLPAAVLFAVLILYPMLAALSYSFFDWQGTKQGGFAGVANYITLLTKEPYASELWNAFGHNLLLFAGALVFQNSLGLGIATLLHRRKRT